MNYSDKGLKIKSISERVSIAESKTDDGKPIWSVVVLPFRDKWKMLGLAAWIIAWTVSGLLIIGSYKTVSNDNQRIFIIVFAFFWLYYEWKMIKVFMWRKWGKERLWYKDGLFIMEESYLNRKKVQSFRKEDINEVQTEEIDERNFFDFISGSFWSKGKPLIRINVLGKNLYFAYQVSDNEARKIFKALKELMK
ncbi:MAG: hypothetical protein KatS3mg028_0765 [Bacteroidia bacterium]|nr:MAG: hypothetical protein KatS3mg028_0765 [Bacteroidia bacterium]